MGSAEQATNLIQKLSLDPKEKKLEKAETTQKTSVYQYGSANSVNVPNVQALPYQQSISPALPELADHSMYFQNGYPASAYYFGGHNGNGSEHYDNQRFLNPETMAYGGIFGDNLSVVYPPAYSFAPYGPFSPASTPVPTVAIDGQLYGQQQYQYPSYFPPPTQGPVSGTIEQKPSSLESGNAAGVVTNGGVVKGNSGSVAAANPAYQNQVKGALTGSFAASGYQNPSLGYDGVLTSVPNGKHKSAATKTVPLSSKASSFVSSRDQSYRSNSHVTGMQQATPMTGYGAPGYITRVYPNKVYGQYGSNGRSGTGYGSGGYDSRTYGRGWISSDGKYGRHRGRGYNYMYGNENTDGLNELNRGPRAKSCKIENGVSPTTNVKKGENENSCPAQEREGYNKQDFPEEYSDAKFFVIKSYSEDDVHQSIKYKVWSSTPNGNKKLDAAYREAQQKSSRCPVFLFFSVNTSGQFVGMAEMVGPVDFEKNMEYWQQDKWTGSFPVNWLIVKDVPNSLLKHITLENNENKPVTNSRDTQEVNLAQGLKVLKIFKNHLTKTCILDDFEFYEARQKVIVEKKAKQQSQKQVWEKSEAAKEGPESTDLAKEPTSAEANGDVKNSESGSNL